MEQFKRPSLPQIVPDGASAQRVSQRRYQNIENEDVLLEYAEDVQQARKERYAMQKRVEESKQCLEQSQESLLDANSKLLQEERRFSAFGEPSQALISSLTRELLEYEQENQELFRRLEDVKRSKNYQYKENAESELRQIVDDYATELARRDELRKRLSDLTFECFENRRASQKAEPREAVTVEHLASAALAREPTLSGSGNDQAE